jgi:hypothetical protein
MSELQPQKIIQLLDEEQIKDACQKGFRVVRLSFDNYHNPVVFASKEQLSDRAFIAYAESIGFHANNYYVKGIIKNK